MLIYVTDRPRMRAHVSAKYAELSRSKYSGRSQLLNSLSVSYGRWRVTSLQIDCVRFRHSISWIASTVAEQVVRMGVQGF